MISMKYFTYDIGIQTIHHFLEFWNEDTSP